MSNESPDTIHGRMKEGAHIAGYGLTRAMDNLKWLLEGSRYEELSAGYGSVNDFLRDTEQAFRLLKIDPAERKQIATLVKELQPEASQRAIADMVGVSEKTVAKDLGYDRQAASLDAKERVKEPETASLDAPQPWTVDDTYDPAAGYKPKSPIIPQSTGNEWWTPTEYIESVRSVMQHIDLDPASCEEANAVVRAATFYGEEDDGLAQPWSGKVFMNPPYSMNKPFAEKMIAEYEAGNVEEAIVLLGAHAIETKWFANYWDYVLCFTGHRIKFNTPSGPAVAGNIAGSVFIYLGSNQQGFAKEFEKHGYVVKRWS